MCFHQALRLQLGQGALHGVGVYARLARKLPHGGDARAGRIFARHHCRLQMFYKL